jgi:(E)-4-hydroxy-3-methylbut-2-enyl-diphosphate synthase
MSYNINRKLTKKIVVGDIFIGGDAPITVQSMTNTDTRNIICTIEQIKRLKSAGCDIVRLAVLDNEAATAIKTIKSECRIPIVADIHFDYRLAIACIENGADKIRINPGNIGDIDGIRMIVKKAKEREIPIRIGVNSGSLEKHLLKKYNGVTPQAMVESALSNAKILEDLSFDNILFSLKSSNVMLTILANRLLSKITQYPLHIGVTEAGTQFNGIIKSSVGIGTLLSEGIGDTIRVSLTCDPVEEIKAGISILKAFGYKKGTDLVSCPTCGRCNINLISIASEIEKELSNMNSNLKVAIMGCVVNGIGEAKGADIGIAAGKGEVLLFKKGKIIRKISEENIVKELVNEMRMIL